MKKAIVSLLASILAVGTWAQEDITAKYLVNPSFEADDLSRLSPDNTRGAYSAPSIQGWELTGGYGVSDLMTAAATATDNNFGRPGTPTDGTKMYYIRHAWNAASASLLQTITLPRGRYRLSVDNKCATASAHTARIVAANESANFSWGTSMTGTWNTTHVDFELDKETAIQVGLAVNFGSGSGASVLVDNFRLYDIKDMEEVPEPTERDVTSPTEGIITADFVDEATMKADLLKMLARFSQYMVADFFDCAYPNSINETCGYFNGESSGQANEAGVRTNADLSMVCAFLVKYGKPAGVKLPDGVTWERVEEIAMKSLVFAYSTHKANKLKVCAGSTQYWGSTSNADHVWESSLWAMSVAYSAYFQWDKLTEKQRGYIYAMMKAECNYELQRDIPTGYAGDTKAEENGWEADILAATLGLFPNDPLAPQWFERLREFAINSYSHYADASNTTVIDPEYNGKTVADLYRGNNLYGDYTLQNHNLFHTSYQNVVMQELGEAALALKMFQTGIHGTEKWKTNALMHNNQQVMDNVLNWLALADGELAMPNGNDWSLFLYDQITSYTTQACFQQDPAALMLENLAYKQIQARQRTTADGSWLLRPDVSARRMGVEAHRVMMTFLMHDVLSTAALTPTTWEQFRQERSEARILPYQNVVRAYTQDRFTTFSWSTGLKSYTGYFAANCPDKNKIVVPYRANNTGNITGWYEVEGKGTNATPVVSGIYTLDGDAYTMNGELNTNDATLNNRFAIYSTPGNALIYLDYVTALAPVTITAEKGGLLAISTDELTKTQRTIYYGKESIRRKQTDGATFLSFNSDWANVDNEIGIVGQNGKKVAFGDRGANNSIFTSKLYPMFANERRTVAKGDIVDARHLVYYNNVDAEMTAAMNSQLVTLKEALPQGWNAVIAPDPDGTRYLLISHFTGDKDAATISNIGCDNGAPVFPTPTTISADGTSSADFTLRANHSMGSPLRIFLKGMQMTAVLDKEDHGAAFLTPLSAGNCTVAIVSDGHLLSKTFTLEVNQTYRVYAENGEVKISPATVPSEIVPAADFTGHLVNPDFDESATGWMGAPVVNYSAAEKFNTNFDIHQSVTGLPAGIYRVECQGFYRNGTYNAAATQRANGKEQLNSLFYATSSIDKVSQPLISIFSEAGKAGTVGVKQSRYGYIPNTMEQASFYFNAGLYPNTLMVKVGEDGALTLGVKKVVATSEDWCIFDHFRLTLVAPHGTATISTRDGENTTTFVAPFAAAIPDGVSAYSVASITANDQLQLQALADSIPAHQPVILCTDGTREETVDGYIFSTQSSATDANGYLHGVYTEGTVPAGAYALGNRPEGQVFCRVAEGEEPLLAAYQAYLTPLTDTGAPFYTLLFPGTDGITQCVVSSRGTLYDLQGRVLHRPARRGIFIQDKHKKFIP